MSLILRFNERRMIKKGSVRQVVFSIASTLIVIELIRALKEGDTSKTFSCVVIFLLVAVLYVFILKRTK